MRLLRLLVRCLHLLRPIRGHIAALCAGVAVLTVVLIVPALVIIDLVWTRALQGEPLPPEQAALLWLDPTVAVDVERLSAAVRHTVIYRAVMFIAAGAVFVIPAGLGLWYYQVWILQRLNQLLRVRLLERLQALSLRYHTEARVGDALYRLTQDSAMVTALIDVLVLTPLYTVGGYLLALGLVSLIDPRLGLLLMAAWIPALAAGVVFTTPLRREFRHARFTNAALTARIQEVVAGMRVLKAYGAAAEEQRRFEAASRTAFDAAFTARHRFTVYSILVFAGVTTLLALAAAWAAMLTHGEAELFAARLFGLSGVTAWNLGVFHFFKDRFGNGTNALRRLLRTWGRAQDVGAGLERVFAILDLEPEVRDAPHAIALPPPAKGLALRNVTFRYRADRPVLEAVTLDVPVGGITAVVGHTGAGKSTVLALALRLFDPDAGTVEIDGVDLRTAKISSVRSHVAIALQEHLLFGTTIRENIRYAVPGAGDAAVRAAARVACADEFIEALPQGYDTPLGERGTKLSTGQRQRLSIARAVLKDAPILLLDEPTAALDAETEKRVMQRLTEWGRGRAILLVTHRLSTARNATRIAVLQHGRLVECGSHAELAARPDGVYRRLLDADAMGHGALV